MIVHNLDRWSDAQKKAIQTRGQNVLVSAGAGSGKTSVLIERVIQCITGEGAVDLSRLLVVTFTEAAAAEMRTRLVARLTSLAEEYRGDTEAERQISRQLMQVESAQISTLHSFCMQVVRRNFLRLGLEPHFGILGEDDALLAKTRIVETLLEEWLKRDSTGEFRRMLRRFRVVNPAEFSGLVFRIDAFSRSQPHPKQWLRDMGNLFAEADKQPLYETVWYEPLVAIVLRGVEDAITLVEEAALLANGQEELQAYADNLTSLKEVLVSARQELTSNQDFETILSLLQAADSLVAASPRAKAHPAKERVQKARNSAKAIVRELCGILSRGMDGLMGDVRTLAPDIQALVDFVLDFQTEFADWKRTHGVVDFGDLEHFALDTLLDPDSGEAVYLQEQFAEIFVDEYQDTSPIQDALVEALARPEGNMFLVGDVKQSIYRFRMAEPGLFLEKYRTLGRERPGTVIDLAFNYRSRKEVVDAVNFFFVQLFSRDFGGIVYDEKAQMHFGASYYPTESIPESLAGEMELHLIERRPVEPEAEETNDAFDASDASTSDENAEKGDEADGMEDLSHLEKEAIVIARRIQELMGIKEGQMRRAVWDVKLGRYRPIQYRDIVVLMRSVSGRMNTMLEVFRSFDIPAHGATSTGFYGALEVAWVLAALSAIDNPRRDTEFLTLLRSPFARFTDVDLAQIRLVCRGTLYECMRHIDEAARTGSSSSESGAANKQETASASHSVPRDVAEKVRSFMRQFAKWRRLARRSSTEEVLRQLFADTAFLEYIAGMRGGEIRTANIEALMDRARAFDRASSDGVFGFVRQAKQHIELEIDHGEAATLGENADVVRIMTIHQSKGLEFPVVFVADLGKQFFQSHEEKSFLLHRRLGFGPQFYDMDTHRRWKTLPSLAIEQVERQETLAEEARVLYVALTRAREKLILVGSGSKLPQVLSRHARAFHPTEYALPISTLLRAKSYLDWVIPAVMRHVDGSALWSIVDSGEAPEVRDDVMRHHPVRIGVRLYQLPGFDEVPVPVSASAEPVTSLNWNGLDSLAEQLRQAEAQGEDEGCPQRQGVMGDTELDATSNMGVITPPLVQMTLPNAPSKVSATDLRRLWVARINGGRNVESIRSRKAAEQLLDVPAFVERTSLSGKESGTAFHTVMQHIDFKMDGTIESVTERIEQLHQMGLLSDEQRQAVDVEDVVAFLRSPLASRLKDAEYVLREQNFFHRIGLADSSREDAYVIVQGVIDCLAKVGETHWLLIDYKTDRIKAEEAQDKAREYSAQIAAYIDVLMATHPGHQVEAYVYFVKPRVALPMQSVPLHQVFE